MIHFVSHVGEAEKEDYVFERGDHCTVLTNDVKWFGRYINKPFSDTAKAVLTQNPEGTAKLMNSQCVSGTLFKNIYLW